LVVLSKGLNVTKLPPTLFPQDNDLLHKLTSFLDTISGKNMKKWVDCIIKIVQRRLSNDEANKDIIFDFDRSPPPIEIHIDNPDPGWPELLTVSKVWPLF
jgi:son of sevenless-like protein